VKLVYGLMLSVCCQTGVGGCVANSRRRYLDQKSKIEAERSRVPSFTVPRRDKQWLDLLKKANVFHTKKPYRFTSISEVNRVVPFSQLPLTKCRG
jgi:hypothetical protein